MRSSAEINSVFQRNIVYLEDYLRTKSPSVSVDELAEAQTLVQQMPGMSLAQLFAITQHRLTRDQILSAIAEGHLYVDLGRVPLVEQERTAVYVSQSSAPVESTLADATRIRLSSFQIGTHIDWNSRTWTVANLGESVVSLLSGDGNVVELSVSAFENLFNESRLTVRRDQNEANIQNEPFRRASAHDLDIAFERTAAVRSGSGRLPSGQSVSSRTLSRWRSQFQQAEESFGNGVIGLLPKTAERGNRNRKLPHASLRQMSKHIKNDYETAISKSKYASWIKLKSICEEKGIIAPSYTAFCSECNRRPAVDQIRRRKGSRVAYKFEPPTLYLEVSTPRHGERPFEVCHLDHTELDIELISEATGKNLGRPWLTLLTDAFSRRVLGSWLTFDPPSYRSCMMVMRDCVKRYSRFPQILVVDGGSDFKSKYFEQLLARCECIKKTRPAAKSRFGSVIERLFGTCNTEFIHSLRGNTKITRNVRQVTESVNPRKLATWTFRELSERLGQYLFDVYDQCEHPALQQSPRETFLQGLNRHGERLQRRICFDDAFKFLTLPTTLKGTAKLEPGQGVQIHYLHYWSEAFREPELFGKQLPVRYDPFDASVAYAYCRNRWVECRSSLFLTFRGRSEREIAIATQELRQRSRHTKAARYGINAKLLADFLRSAESDELLSLQRERDREMKGEPVRPERATIGEMEIKTGAAPLIESRKQEIAKENRKNYGEF